MTNTAIDFNRKPHASMEPEYWAYWHTSDLPSVEPWSLVFVVRHAPWGSDGRWYALVEFGNDRFWASFDEMRLPLLVCEECGEPAQEQPPTSMGLASLRSTKLHRYSHLDGEPLCPVMGADGYEPCRAV